MQEKIYKQDFFSDEVPTISHALAGFNKFYKEINDIYHEIALNAGLSDSSFDILYSIFELGDGCLQSDIRKISFLPKQTINSSIHNLEKKGYIYFSNGTGRAKHINLTDEGKILIREKIYPIIKCENNSFSLLTEHEQTFVLNIFDKYIHSLRTEFNKLKNLHRR